MEIKTRDGFRKWLMKNGQTEKECWVEVKRGKPASDGSFWYLDAVEEALCFGWIDSVTKEINGKRLQRFSPRKKKSFWTELNKERVLRLERLGLMTKEGRAVLPDMEKPFTVDKDIEKPMRQAGVWGQFTAFPPLYQRVRAYNVAIYKEKNKQAYEKALAHLIEQTKIGKMFGNWNDYGRLL